MDTYFSELLKAVDLVAVAAIIGVTFGIRQFLHEDYWRWIPAVPLVLGLVAGWILTPEPNWRIIAKAALFYGGAASIMWELGRTTVFKAGAKTEAKEL